MRGERGEEGSRGVAPVIGVVLLVAITVLLATAVGAVVYTFGENEPQAPLQASLTIQSVEKSDEHIVVPQESVCGYYHLTIRMSHHSGDTLNSGELEYLIEISGEDGSALSGQFNESVAEPDVTANAGDELVIALDSNTTAPEGDCGTGGAEGSKSAVLFGDDAAWDPDAVGQVGDLADIYGTYLDNGEGIVSVRVRVVHTPSETIVIDQTTTDITDRSPG